MIGIIGSFLVCLAAQSASVPANTSVDARIEAPVKTETSKAGDAVVAIVAKPIREGSRVIVPKGSRLNGRIETIQPATLENPGRVRLVFREIQLPDGRRIETWITNSFDASSPKRNRRYALSMATGAAAGGLVGGKAARFAGVLGGALTGFVIAESLGNSKPPDVTLKPGEILHLQLGEDLRLD